MADLFKKLQFKASSAILLLSAPDEFLPRLAELDASVQIDSQLGGATRYDFALVFVKSCAEVEMCAAPVVTHMNDDAVLWFAYPKKSSKRYTTDLGRDGGWQPLGGFGLQRRAHGGDRRGLVGLASAPRQQDQIADAQRDNGLEQ